jgi:hypothetical protein
VKATLSFVLKKNLIAKKTTKISLLLCALAGVHQQRYQENARQRLDMAVLGFFQNFRKVYIGEQVGGRAAIRKFNC